MASPPLLYHGPLFLLLREKPVLSRERLKEIEEWEGRENVRLPAAVREWFSLAPPSAVKHSSDEGEMRWAPLDEVLGDLSEALRGRWAKLSPRFTLATLPWDGERPLEVRLTGRDDPPVKPGFDADGEKFSEAVFKACWGTVARLGPHFEPAGWGHRDLVLCAEARCGWQEVAYLRRCFDEGAPTIPKRAVVRRRHPRTDHPMLVRRRSHLRFSGEKAYLWIDCAGNPLNRSVGAKWILRADTEEALLRAGNFLLDCGAVADALDGETPAGRAVLRRLRVGESQ